MQKTRRHRRVYTDMWYIWKGLWSCLRVLCRNQWLYQFVKQSRHWEFLCAQDMLYTKNMLELMGLKVKLPMVLEMDNKGADDLANNWSVKGRIRHVDVRQCFLRELKESKIMDIR
jgi:hypothetical protein